MSERSAAGSGATARRLGEAGRGGGGGGKESSKGYTAASESSSVFRWLLPFLKPFHVYPTKVGLMGKKLKQLYFRINSMPKGKSYVSMPSMVLLALPTPFFHFRIPLSSGVPELNKKEK